jgi:predicted aspartyl protease
MAKIFVSRLNAIIRCIVSGGLIAILICASCPLSAEQPPAKSSDLDLLLARKQYDKFEREFTARAARLTAEDRTYFGGVLANRINLVDRSILLLQPLISGLLMSNPVHAEYALCTLADNYARNFRYGKAANTYLQAALVAEANRAESTCNARHEAARWALLDGAPPQTIQSSGPFALSGSNDSLGLLRVPVNVGTYAGSWILDTGANLSVVSRSVADRLGLAVSTRTADAAASSGHSVPVRVAVIPQIQLGPALIRNVAVLVAEDSDLTFPSINYRIEGCLGLPVLMALGAVSVVQGASVHFAGSLETRPGNSAAHNIFLERFTPVVIADFGHGDQLFTVDTGAIGTILSMAFFGEGETSIDAGQLRALEILGAGGSVVATAYEVDGLVARVDGHCVTPQLVDILTQHSNSTDEFYGNVGQNVLGLFASYTFDFRSMHFSVTGGDSGGC